MIPGLLNQATGDPDYHIVRPIPSPKVSPETLAVDGAVKAPATTVSANWVEVCAVNDVDEDDVIGFEYNGKSYAVYRLSGDRFYASDGLCTHEQTVLAGGLVTNGCIECPRHNGRFDVTTGQAVRAPARKPLKTSPAERRGDKVYINLQG
jgi:3-phenylpropionate/trans-cinnamate dioxygenase ferredoxin subunit